MKGFHGSRRCNMLCAYRTKRTHTSYIDLGDGGKSAVRFYTHALCLINIVERNAPCVLRSIRAPKKAADEGWVLGG